MLGIQKCPAFRPRITGKNAQHSFVGFLGKNVQLSPRNFVDLSKLRRRILAEKTEFFLHIEYAREPVRKPSTYNLKEKSTKPSDYSI